jgi:ABC-type branched-subunit amino acid transport system ATPase component
MVRTWRSTLPQGVSGVLRPRRGTIAFAGQDVTGWPSHKLVRHGIWGLASVLVDGIFELLEQLNAQGRTVLLVGQNALASLAVARVAGVHLRRTRQVKRARPGPFRLAGVLSS